MVQVSNDRLTLIAREGVATAGPELDIRIIGTQVEEDVVNRVCMGNLAGQPNIPGR